MTLAEKQVPAAMILIVEDDNDLADLINMHLSFQGHNVVRVTSLQQARQALTNQSFELLVLDRGLEDGDGLSLCQAIRHHQIGSQPWLPVLVLTARDAEKDKVEGLESGADDYLTKPFSVLEFQARVRAMLRRQHFSKEAANDTDPTTQKHNDNRSHVLNFGDLIINPTTHKVELKQDDISLTATEFTLLHFLAKKPGRVYSKDELLEAVWQTHFSGYHHTVCSTINRLRTKLNASNEEHKYIHTVWGVGYKFEA
ncbi:response regulator transcription factor [Photobacterium sp. ZSDE20]|uniref:Response regulator transcription factor n=1 Tax=Photobacterium pectinilyticum TaxID=2906793 RepID=A0ABT1N1L5_9GAMM|nr:response regulator transcription factor [Photobacterium sp. ZSDE20]MCQ1058623.1 response regulator transcription factor [Photobacterium sp. ZSDE20]MDD1824057.1 response regulator transcription factor [Photobacterium sp. ZSDE20]